MSNGATGAPKKGQVESIAAPGRLDPGILKVAVVVLLRHVDEWGGIQALRGVVFHRQFEVERCRGVCQFGFVYL